MSSYTSEYGSEFSKLSDWLEALSTFTDIGNDIIAGLPLGKKAW